MIFCIGRKYLGVSNKIISVGFNVIDLFMSCKLSIIVMMVIDNIVKKFKVNVDKKVIWSVFIVVFW